MSLTQSEFRAALLDPNRAAPKGLSGPDGPAGKRFDVYRNNVAVSLTEALRVAFPVIRKLVGDQFFDAMAGVYLRAHPPRSPRLMFYGADMPVFLKDFEPAQHLGYLPDVARLELGLRESYHAADAPVLDPTELGRIDPDALMEVRITLHPALRLLRSDWPVHAIWRFNTEEGAPKPPREAQDVLITRPEFDPAPHLLPRGAHAFLAALAEGEKFGAAANIAGAEARGADLSAILGACLSAGAFSAISKNEGQK